jgi:hypothetical protein
MLFAIAVAGYRQIEMRQPGKGTTPTSRVLAAT